MTLATTTLVQITIGTRTQTDKNKPCNNSGRLNKITNLTHTSNNILSNPEINKEHCDSDSAYSLLNSSLDSE